MNESPFDNQRMRPGLLVNSNTVGAQRAEPISPVEQSMHRLSVEVDNLHSELRGLYDRLTPYLADTPPSIEKNPPLSAVVGNSPAILRITELSNRIAIMASELVSIKQRLEA